MTSTSTALKQVFDAGRPLVKQWLEIAEQIAALRDVATAHGLDWSQVKALLKAQVQDEMDENGDGKRVRRIVDRAEFASAYADMLGLANMNENIFSPEPQSPVASGMAEISGGLEQPQAAPAAPIQNPPSPPATHPAAEVEGVRPRVSPSTDLTMPEIPSFMDRRRQTEAA